MNVLYSENDWVYVVSDEDKEGFIPNSYCAAYGTQQASLILNMKKKMPRGNMFIGDPGPGPGMQLLPIIIIGITSILIKLLCVCLSVSHLFSFKTA